jgi:cell wall-associated NlpC family hydrolase
MLKHSALMDYSQGPDRWSGIEKHLRSYKGQVPHKSDCSSSSSWKGWDSTLSDKPRDFFNGTAWRSGYTGTMQDHGKRVKFRVVMGKPIGLLPGDRVFYGDQGGGVAKHVADYVGNGLVVSHGSAGAHLLRWDYRDDFNEARRYYR